MKRLYSAFNFALFLFCISARNSDLVISQIKIKIKIIIIIIIIIIILAQSVEMQ